MPMLPSQYRDSWQIILDEYNILEDSLFDKIDLNNSIHDDSISITHRNYFSFESTILLPPWLARESSDASAKSA